MGQEHPARQLRRNREDAARCKQRQVLTEIEFAERDRWRDRAEGLLTGALHLQDVIAALCADACTESGVSDRIRAIPDAVELLAGAGLIRPPLLTAVRETLTWLLAYPDGPDAGPDTAHAQTCSRARELGIALPHLLADSA